MRAPLIDLLRGGVPALAVLVAAIAVIRIVCRRPTLRRLSVALSLIALTGSVALFRALAPAEAPYLDPYLRFLMLFSLAYGAFKVVEVLVVDLLVILRKEALRPLLVADPTVLERLSKTLARRQAERDDAINRAAVYEGPGRTAPASYSAGCGGSSDSWAATWRRAADRAGGEWMAAEQKVVDEKEPVGLRLSLKVKLTLLITTLLVLTVLLVSVFLVRQEQESLTNEMSKRGRTIARDLANASKNPIISNDDLTLSLLVQDAMKDPDVIYVIFVDADGKVVAHPDLSQIGLRFQRSDGLPMAVGETQVTPFVDPKHGKVIDFAVPLVFSRVSVGSLYLGFSRKPIDEAVATARNSTIVISAAMVIVGILGALGLSTVLSRPVMRLVEGTQAVAAGNFQIHLPVTSRDEIGALTESFNQMAKNLREKEMIKRAFTRYVARQVVDEILKDPEKLALKEERRDVTVLFCDMRGFTSLAERLSPEEVVGVLNDFYTLMVDTTAKNDGIVDKFLGDGVMAIFGAPIVHDDHPVRAVKTAVAMQAAVAELSRKRAREGKDPIAVGVGVSAGEAVAGTVGTEDRMEYTVIGDSVNLAARLESNAKPDRS